MSYRLAAAERATIKARMAQILARDSQDYASRILYRQILAALGVA